MPQWPKSKLVAWNYMVSGVEQGISATAAVKQYRAGGGAISNEFWYSGYREAFSQKASGERIVGIPETYTISEGFATESGFDWREKYIMQMKVFGHSPETGEPVARWVTVESDELLTKSEWRDYAQRAISDTIGSDPLMIEAIRDWKFYKRMPFEV